MLRQRRICAGLAAVLIAGGLLGIWLAWEPANVAPAAMRIGLVLAILAWAMPGRYRPAAWAKWNWASWLALIGILVLVAWVKWAIIPFLVALAVLTMFSGRGKPRPTK